MSITAVLVPYKMVASILRKSIDCFVSQNILKSDWYCQQGQQVSLISCQAATILQG